MNLSPRLTLEECTRSNTAVRFGIDNTPSPEVIANLTRLANDLYEPICDLLGYEITVSSGYRSPALNKKLKGAATSLHMDGLALDLDPPPNKSVRETFDLIRQAPLLLYEEIIEEFGSWVHIAIPLKGAMPKREQMRCDGFHASTGRPIYIAVPAAPPAEGEP